MSDEAVGQKQNIFGQVKSALIFPVATTGIGAVNNIVRNRGVSKAVESLELTKFKQLNATLKSNGADIFTRGLTLANNHDALMGATKSAKKAANVAETLAKNGNISIIQKGKNAVGKIFGRNNQVSAATIKTNAAQTAEQLKATKANMFSAATAAGTQKISLFKEIRKDLKSTIKSPLVLIMTAAGTIPQVIGKIIPTFKEKGFKEGMKEVGKTLLKTGTDMVSYSVTSVVGKIAGTALGTLICPGAGSAIGGRIGAALGSMLLGSKITEGTGKLIDKIGSSEEQTEQTTQVAQNTGNRQQEPKFDAVM